MSIPVHLDPLRLPVSKSHHRHGGGYRNPWPGAEPKGFSGILRWMLWERLVRGRPKDPHPSVFARAEPSFAVPHAATESLTVTWVGHSTLLVQIAGRNVLTDPVWSERASPVPFAGPRRWSPPGVSFERLPPIDVVLLSHNHYDHLDDQTVRRLIARAPDARWVTPLGVGEFVRQRGAARVDELDWWQDLELAGLRVGCTPAQHFSARGPGDRNRTLWCGWAVSGTRHRVFFAGDTGYHPEFAVIARRFGPFDVVLLPIGAYEPRWFMRAVHMNAEEAVRAYCDLRSASPPAQRTAMVPIHWGTFKLTDEPMDEPPQRARIAWRESALPEDDFWLLACGETREL